MKPEPHEQTSMVAGPGVAARMALAFIMTYQRATDHRPSPCRYVPSCSYYAAEAIEVHGAVRGMWLGLRRLLRCRPGAPTGWDPVPDHHGCLASDPTLPAVDTVKGSVPRREASPEDSPKAVAGV